MATKRKYEQLMAWQKAMTLVDIVYDLSDSWPNPEIYGLTSQLRRSVVSVPANIAEGQGRTGIPEFLHHLSIAHGSLMEAETILGVGRRRSFVAEDAFAHAMDV
jgi:four helix bundle protein